MLSKIILKFSPSIFQKPSFDSNRHIDRMLNQNIRVFHLDMDFPSLCSRFHDYEDHDDNHVDDHVGDDHVGGDLVESDREGCHSLNDDGHLNRDILVDIHPKRDSHFDNYLCKKLGRNLSHLRYKSLDNSNGNSGFSVFCNVFDSSGDQGCVDYSNHNS